MQVDGFDLVPRLIGRNGCNTRKIAEAGAKVRIRGRGSGHLELNGKHEAPTPLMIAVTTDRADPVSFKNAIVMTLQELRAVEQKFAAWCQKRNHKHEGPSFSVGRLSDGARDLLSDVLAGVPPSSSAKMPP